MLSPESKTEKKSNRSKSVMHKNPNLFSLSARKDSVYSGASIKRMSSIAS